MGRLFNMRTYLCGPIDRSIDGGVGWREEITPFLHNLGVGIFNPCKKPTELGTEKAEDREFRKKKKLEGKWEELAKEIKLLRIIDLRGVDTSDFVIAYINTDIHLCGSYEEIFHANSIKHPILVMCEQKRIGAPDWLFGCIPFQHIFDSWTDLKNYLLEVDDKGKPVEHFKRWTFLNYSEL